MSHATRDEGAIVVIDNNEVTRTSCRQVLERDGYRVTTCESGTRGLEVVAASRPAVVLLDLNMPDVSGLELLPRLRRVDPDLPIIIITGYPTIESAVAAMKRGAADFLPKPFSSAQLRTIVAENLPPRPSIASTLTRA